MCYVNQFPRDKSSKKGLFVYLYLMTHGVNRNPVIGWERLQGVDVRGGMSLGGVGSGVVMSKSWDGLGDGGVGVSSDNLVGGPQGSSVMLTPSGHHYIQVSDHHHHCSNGNQYDVPADAMHR